MIYGFGPVAGDDPAVLILGSMPSVKSLEASGYYAHPRNAFWPVMFRLTGEPASDDYERRYDMLRRHGIALWDVIAGCERSGSSDSSIRNAEANPIGAWLSAHPTVRLIACNGTTAFRYLGRFFPDLSGAVEIVQLPSTSPANTMTEDRKLAAWDAALRSHIR